MPTPEIFVSSGGHSVNPVTGEPNGRCIMEWVSYLYEQQHSDLPFGVHDTLRCFCIEVNDSVRDDLRQEMVPYLARMYGTAEMSNYDFAWVALDFIGREWTARWLEEANYKDEAAALRALPELTKHSTDAEVEVVGKELARIAGLIPESKIKSVIERGDHSRTQGAVRGASMGIEGSCVVRDNAELIAKRARDAVACAYGKKEAEKVERQVEKAVVGLLDRMLPAKPIVKPKRRGWAKMLGLRA